MNRMVAECFPLSRWDAGYLPLLEFFNIREDLLFEFRLAEQYLAEEEYEKLEGSLNEIQRVQRQLELLRTEILQELDKQAQGRKEKDILQIAALERLYANTLDELRRRIRWELPTARPGGFGRWTFSMEEGLPSVAQCSPNRVSDGGQKEIEILFHRVLDIAVVDVNWISKTYLVRAEVQLEGVREEAEFEVVCSLVFPGFLIVPKISPYGNVLRRETIQRFFRPSFKEFTQFRAKPEAELGSVLLGWEGTEDDRPIFLRFAPHNRDPMAFHITAGFAAGVGTVDTRSWNDPGRRPENLEQFPYIEYLSRNFPYNCREYYKFDPADGRMHIYSIFDYYYPPADRMIGIIPPLISMARKNGYPVEIHADEIIDLGIETFYGPLEGVQTRNGVLHYSLPVPEVQTDVLPGIPLPEKLENHLAIPATSEDI